ncbi:MAG TPA: SAF domain-containing protein [Solirubrobacterales bacterium]|jgi:Flp pilus assembly protein CpaB
MGRRGRAVGFAAAAAICAGLAAGVTAGAPAGEPDYGELREVVVAAEALPARRALGRAAIGETLEIRRVPERFLPPDALTSPAQALGRRPATTVPAGGYLLASQFEPPGAEREPRAPELTGGRRPVEITVEGAGALAAAAGGPSRRVDVVVTSESSPGGGAGRTFVAAAAVGLLDLRPVSGAGTEDVLPGPPSEAWIATLALTRGQALRLIHAQSFAREVRLIRS